MAPSHASAQVSAVEWNGQAQEPEFQIVFCHPSISKVSPVLSPTISHQDGRLRIGRPVADSNQSVIPRVSVTGHQANNVVRRGRIELLRNPGCEESRLARVEGREYVRHVGDSFYERMPK